ncbi:hypothetical protein [Microbispora rosea]|uniref:hypothetical protein n=1 Tax=Microbispora rosea TaxID=58117 RepID=UPI0004C345CE|nr:hypothetical protein [Microbispora rosea]
MNDHGPWSPLADAEPSPLAGVPLTAHVDPPRLHTLPLPGGGFALILSGAGGLPDDEFEQFQRFAADCGAVACLISQTRLEVG